MAAAKKKPLTDEQMREMDRARNPNLYEGQFETKPLDPAVKGRKYGKLLPNVPRGNTENLKGKPRRKTVT